MATSKAVATTDPIEGIAPENIQAALKGFYTPPKPGNVIVAGDDLIALLTTLPSLTADEHVDPVLVQIDKHHSGVSFQPADHAVLSFIDDVITQVLRQTDLDFKIESFIRDLAPYVAVIALKDGVKALTQPHQTPLEIIDLLIRECIGWSEDLGILGEQFMEKIEVIIKNAVKGRTSLDECLAELNGLFEKETPVYATMEQRLCDSQLSVLAGQKGKYFAAQLLNKEMVNKPLPLFIIFMLQGSWYEFLQSVYVHYGQKSKEWARVTRLTESLVWSLQKQDDAPRHESVMAKLPVQIREFCEALTFDTTQVTACLADVEEEYDRIKAGSPSDPCDFELKDVDTTMGEGARTIDREMLKTIEKFVEGQWFLYDDKKESDERVARIKLILNWRDTERMLFTNQNRRKILHMNYGELAGYMTSEVVKVLTPKADARDIARSHLLTVIQGIQQQKKKEIEIDEVQQRKRISQAYLSKRKEALIKALEQHKKLARLKQQRALILRQKAAKKLEAAEEAVHSLKVDAWVKLPVMEGILTPCKLVAIIPAVDKYIFANRGGIKIAEYSGGQLASMIVTENSEILDTGAEFESVLASVVTGLREDRNKSYDELTGNSA